MVVGDCFLAVDDNFTGAAVIAVVGDGDSAVFFRFSFTATAVAAGATASAASAAADADDGVAIESMWPPPISVLGTGFIEMGAIASAKGTRVGEVGDSEAKAVVAVAEEAVVMSIVGVEAGEKEDEA
jgi:hypothetical protein